LGIRFEYGVRLFQAGRHDEAIPVLQGAQVDPRHRERCRLFIGCCFFAKGYYGQAIEVLNQAVEGHEMRGDALDKELHYWLGRAYEQNGDAEAASKMYGQIIQWDYNYLDVRQRMDRLRTSEK
jgi:tetratricopeptide (TPR) repeat protein